MNKEKENGFWKRLKSLMVTKKPLKTGSKEKVLPIRERADLFWEAEADILRQELLDREQLSSVAIKCDATEGSL
jgi:hypothetical protein